MSKLFNEEWVFGYHVTFPQNLKSIQDKGLKCSNVHEYSDKLWKAVGGARTYLWTDKFSAIHHGYCTGLSYKHNDFCCEPDDYNCFMVMIEFAIPTSWLFEDRHCADDEFKRYGSWYITKDIPTEWVTGHKMMNLYGKPFSYIIEENMGFEYNYGKRSGYFQALKDRYNWSNKYSPDIPNEIGILSAPFIEPSGEYNGEHDGESIPRWFGHGVLSSIYQCDSFTDCWEELWPVFMKDLSTIREGWWEETFRDEDIIKICGPDDVWVTPHFDMIARVGKEDIVGAQTVTDITNNIRKRGWWQFREDRMKDS